MAINSIAIVTFGKWKCNRKIGNFKRQFQNYHRNGLSLASHLHPKMDFAVGTLRLNPFSAHLGAMRCPFRASFEITSRGNFKTIIKI